MALPSNSTSRPKSKTATALARPGGTTPTPSLSWTRVTNNSSRRVVCCEIFGETGTGRTTWALSAPGPIFLLHAGEKVDYLLEPWIKAGKEIHEFNFSVHLRGTAEDISAQAWPVWKGVQELLADAYSSGARTIIIDTHTELWQLCVLAYFGSLKPESGRVDSNWGPVNADWMRAIKSGFRAQSSCNLILVGQVKDEYRTRRNEKGKEVSERTGKRISDGMKRIPNWCDARVLSLADKRDASILSTRIIKPWAKLSMMGEEFPMAASNFPNTMAMLTGTDPEEWSDGIVAVEE